MEKTKSNKMTKNNKTNSSNIKVVKGSKVKLDYEGRFESGEVFDSSTHGDHSHPLEFTAGEGQVIPGFDSAVIGLKVGDEKEFSIDAKDAYGEHRAELMREIPKNVLPKGQEPKEGMMIVMQGPDGRQFPVKIAKVTEETMILDMNHPLAGKKLIFKIKVVEIN